MSTEILTRKTHDVAVFQPVQSAVRATTDDQFIALWLHLKLSGRPRKKAVIN